MKNVKKISIIGGTGNLGVPVVKYLLNFGFEVKLIVRNITKAKQLFEPNERLQLVVADLMDVNTLRDALSDTEYLYLNLSTKSTNINIPFSAEREGIANILEAVNKDKIKQIIAISGLGAFDNVQKPGVLEFVPNVIRKQGHKLIKNSGIPYTILHCSWFADSFIMYRRNNVYSVIGNTTTPIYFTNGYNFTVHLVNALGNPDAFFKEFPIQGKEGYLHPNAAKTFLMVYSPQSKVSILPKGLIRVMALFSHELKFVKHMSDYFMGTYEEFLADEFNTYQILGKPQLSLTQYAEKVKDEKIFSFLDKRCV